jgi:hypothetical protein
MLHVAPRSVPRLARRLTGLALAIAASSLSSLSGCGVELDEDAEEISEEGAVASTSQALNTGGYRIRSVKSNKCLDNTGSLMDGARPHQWDCNDSNDNQGVKIYNLGSNQHEIKFTRSGKVFDGDGNGGNGAATQQWTNYGSNNQKWYIDDVGGGKYQIKPVSNPSVCLDLLDGNTANGTRFQLWTCNAANPNQQFYLDARSLPYEYHQEIRDDFNGFDTNTWEKGDGAWADNRCRGQADNVIFTGGEVRLVIQNEWVPGSYSYHEQQNVPGKNCSFGELRTKADRNQNGYFEARIKTPNYGGFIMGLFTFNFDYGASYKRPWREKDHELLGNSPNTTLNSWITNNCNPGNNPWDSWCQNFGDTFHQNKASYLPNGGTHKEQWHVYAIETTPSVIRYLVDGIEVAYRTNTSNMGGWNGPANTGNYAYWDQSEAILMNFWLSSDGSFGGGYNLNDFPGGGQHWDSMDVHIDWFRYYSRG